MTPFYRCLSILFAIFALTGCHKKLPDSTLPSNVKRGTITIPRSACSTKKAASALPITAEAVLLPVNTQVELMEITTKEILVEIMPDHRKLTIENVAKHTGENTTQTFSKLFAKQKLDMSQFTKLEQENIRDGKVAKKMRKNAVIAAVGYPPITETSSTQMNRWVYWSSRFDRFIVHFNDKGKVDRIEN